MKHNLISNFSDFSHSINEGNSYKKNFGVLGPFENWGYKIKSCCQESGGVPDSNSILVSDLTTNLPNLCLKYSYEDGKESDAVYFPKDSFSVSGDSKNPILETKNGIRFWEDEDNQSNLDEFLNSFIESKHFSAPEDDVSGDIDTVLEILGMDSPVVDAQKKKDHYWMSKLEDGTEEQDICEMRAHCILGAVNDQAIDQVHQLRSERGGKYVITRFYLTCEGI